MSTAILPALTGTARDTEPETVGQSPNKLILGFGCVYLTSSIREAERTSALMESALIRIYHAASLRDAEERLKLTRSRILLTNTTFRSGNWKDALQLTVNLRPKTALVLAARLADERLWIGALEHGAYDLIQKPFQADELRRVLENAHQYATTTRPLHMTA
jgi:DNA-binding NtrC family response regulator